MEALCSQSVARFFSWLSASLGGSSPYTTFDPSATTFTFPKNYSSFYPAFNSPPGAAGIYESIANQFTPATSFDVTSFTLALEPLAGPTGNSGVVASIYANNPATNLPLLTAALASVSATTPNPVSASSSTETIPLTDFAYSGVPLTLAAGTPYWLVLTPARSGSDVGWGYGTLGVSGRVATSTDGNTYTLYTPGGYTTQSLAAFRFNDPVPEPSTWALGAVAFVGLLLAVRGRRCR